MEKMYVNFIETRMKFHGNICNEAVFVLPSNACIWFGSSDLTHSSCFHYSKFDGIQTMTSIGDFMLGVNFHIELK